MKKTKLATEVAEYPRATWLGSPHFGFPQGAHGDNTPLFIVIHGTGYQSNQTAEGVANDFATTNPNSAHFAIDRQGVVYQMVRVRDSAWANGVMSGRPGVPVPGDFNGPHAAYLDALQAKFGNLNKCSVSIEHVNDSNNSLAPTPAQMASSFALVAWLCKTYNIPARAGDANGGIIGHFDIDPAHRALCPGNYPFADLFAFLNGAVNMQEWLAPGAVAFSEFARQSSGTYKHGTCVEAAAEACAVAQHPSFRLPGAQVGDFLAQMVAQWHAADPGGVDPVSGASSFVDATAWLRGLGFKVDQDVFDASNWWETLVAGLEQHSVFIIGVTNAQGLHGDEPGVHNHGLAALGIDSAGNIICGDPDNQASQVNMPGNPYGNFVVYTKQDLANGQVSSLTRVYPMAGVPNTWSDDGTTLTAQPTAQGGTGQPVVAGFRDYILTNPWLSDDQPLGPEYKVDSGPLVEGNGTEGPGSVQVFRRRVLCWTEGRGVFEAWTGSALMAALKAAPPAPTPPPAPAPGPTLPPDLQSTMAAVANILNPLAAAAADVARMQKELGF